MAKKSTMAMAGVPGTFDGEQPETVAVLEALDANPTEAWPEGTWVETAHGGERYWDGEAWQQGRAPAPEEPEGDETDETEGDGEEGDEPVEGIAATAAHLRKTRAY